MNQEPFRLKDVQVYRTREATFCEILAALLTAGCWVAAIVRPETKHFIFSALCTFTVVYILTATYRPKLLFMGQDFAQEREWSEARSLDWHLVNEFGHRDVLQCVRNLLEVYKRYPSLYSDSKDSRTFEWVNRHDAERNIVAFIRRNPWNYSGAVLVVCSFSGASYQDYTVGVPLEGQYRRVFSTYDSLPGGGSPGEIGGVPALDAQWHDCDGYSHMLTYSLRPFESVIFEFPEY